MNRSRRVDRAAEREFARMCSDAGVLCQHATEDESGWDFMVEFQAKPFAGPPESQPPGKRAYVQIKSRTQAGARTAINLSNARRMAQEAVPWFIVLFHEPAKGPRRLYAQHVWDTFIADALKRIRKAGLDGHKLHIKHMPISFVSADGHDNDLLEWMERTIDQRGRCYPMDKEKLFAESGFENGGGTGKFTIVAPSEAAIAEAFLGLGDGIEVSDFTFVPERFGLPASEPLIKMEVGRLTVEPIMKRGCSVRLRRRDTTDVIAYQGTVVDNGLAQLDPELARLHFQAGFFSIVSDFKGTANLRLTLDAMESHPVSYLRDYARAMAWLTGGLAEIEVWVDGRRVLKSVSINIEQAPDWVNRLANICEGLLSMAGPADKLSLQDIAVSKSIALLLTLVSNRALRYDFERGDIPPTVFDQFLYYAVAEVGTKVFCTLVARQVVHQQNDEDVGWVRLQLGPPNFIEHYCATSTAEGKRCSGGTFRIAL